MGGGGASEYMGGDEGITGVLVGVEGAKARGGGKEMGRRGEVGPVAEGGGGTQGGIE